MPHVKESRLLRRFSHVLEGAKYAREKVYNCPYCMDTGFVTILRPEVVVEQASNTRFEGEPQWHRRCCALCDCEIAQKKDGIDMELFGDRKWHINVNDPDYQEQARNYGH